MRKIIKSTTLTEFYTKEGCFITELLNTKNFTNFSVAQARVAPGVSTAIHQLKETDEVYYILSGKGKMEIGGEVTGIVAEKDLVFIPKNMAQRITNISDKDLVFLCICTPRFEVKNYEQ